MVELGLLRGGRQFAVEQQVADLEEVACSASWSIG